MSTLFWDTYVKIFSEKSGLPEVAVTESLVKMVGEPSDRKVFLLIDENVVKEQDFHEHFPTIPKLLLRGILRSLRKDLPDYDFSVYGVSVSEIMDLAQEDFISYEAFLMFTAGLPAQELQVGEIPYIYSDVSQGVSSNDPNLLECVRVNIDNCTDPLGHLKKFGPLTGLCDLPKFFVNGEVPAKKFLVEGDSRPLITRSFIFPGTIISVKGNTSKRYIPEVTFSAGGRAHFRLLDCDSPQVFLRGSIYMIIERKHLSTF